MPITLDGSGSLGGINNISTSASVNVSGTELGYLDNTTSAIQSQINTAGGLVKITDQTFSAASTVNVNNCFTSTYDNYRVFIDFSAASTTLALTMRLRVSGTDNSTTNYFRQNMSAQSTTVSASQTASGTSWGLAGSIDNTYISYNRYMFDIFGPQLTRYTVAVVPSLFVSTTPQYYSNLDAYLFNATTSFDGFSLLASTGNVTGTLRVYGYRN